jgi:hypothetical protein
MRRAALALGLFAVLPSCSLLGLDGFAVVRCDNGIQCDVVNDRDRIPDEACERWVCDPDSHTCFFGMRDDDGDEESPPSCGGEDCDDMDPLRGAEHPEACDGVDNDCNDAIDDLMQPSALVQTSGVVATIPNGRDARYGANGSTHAALTLAASGASEPIERAALVLLDGASESAPSDIEHQTPSSTTFGETAFVDGCPQGADGRIDTCNERDAAISGDGSRWVVASVSNRNCGGADELRIAPLASSTDTHVRHQGPNERSHIWVGVGLDASGCTINPDGSIGARAPALSVPPVGGEPRLREGLASYLADSMTRTCEDETEIEVEALGLWLSESGDRAWVEATGNGAPTPMGTTRSLGGPSIAAWPGVGWLVAFGDAAGGVALRFAASPLPTPPPVPEADQFYDTAPLPRVDLPTIGAADVERVAIALGDIEGRTAELGIAFQEGCDARVHFVNVLVDLDAMTAAPIGAPIDLGVGEDPAIAHVDAGLNIDADRPGGFVVLFAAATAGGSVFRAARIADATGALVGEIFDVGTGTRAPHLYPGASSSQLRFAYMHGSALIGGSLFCAPPLE